LDAKSELAREPRRRLDAIGMLFALSAISTIAALESPPPFSDVLTQF
jgi:hypothetical protein